MNQIIKKNALRHALRILLQRIVGSGIFFISAGTFYDIRGIIYISLYLITSIVSCILLLNGHQETLSAREEKRENTKKWDKIIMPLLVILMFHGIYLVAGLGIRFQWNKLPMEYFYIGIIICIFASAFTLWSVMVNKHLEPTARIQDDRSHNVISDGPYKIVRHPAYASVLVWAIAITLIFGTIAVGIVSLAIIILIISRTHLEDSMLKRELQGYMEYSKTVKYRLIPFLW